jgi:DNA-directed RNA polymerase subunit RPC12/RpoP
MTVSTDFDNNLLREGILRYRVKEFDAARRFLERALDNADDDATRLQAHYYLSLLTDDPTAKRRHLEETLAIDLSHAEARRALALLDGRLQAGEIVNPDALPAAKETSLSADRFTCPKCGGRRVYAPDGVSLVCEFCQRQESLASGRLAGEQDFFAAMATLRGHRAPTLMQTFRCNGCGAEFVLPPGMATAACSFCDSLHVAALESCRELLAPDGIIPMAFGPDEAARRMAEWAAKNRLELAEPLQPRGLFLPVWTFDMSGQIPWNGKVRRNKRLVPVSGTVQAACDDLCLPASASAAALLEKTLGEYSLSTAAAYDPRFLAGWPARVQEGVLSDAALEARRRTVERARSLIRAEYGLVQDLSYSTAGVTIHSYKLVLVPVWLAAYELDGRSYNVLVNGLLGSVHGDLPARKLYGFLGGLLGG